MQHLLIYGLGVSGIAAARLATHLHIPVEVWDDNLSAIRLPQDLTNLAIANPHHNMNTLTTQATLMPSPGIPECTPIYQQLLHHCEQRLFSEVDFGLSHLPAPVLALTGTNGKSTCCAMIRHLFECYQLKLEIIGNFGTPTTQAALAHLQSPPHNQAAVSTIGYILELSSYQLSQSRSVDFPVSVITNFAPDHLERHHTPETYFRIKWQLNQATAAKQHPQYLITTAAVLSHQQRYGLPTSSRQIITTPTSHCVNELKHLACHASHYFANYIDHHHSPQLNPNTRQALHHLATTQPHDLLLQLQSFRGLPHRLETINPTARRGAPDHKSSFQCEFINDAKSTNLHATAYAIRSISSFPHNTLLILGGIPKSSAESARLMIPAWIKWVVIIGQHTSSIHQSLNLLSTADTQITTAPTLKSLMKPSATFIHQLKHHQITRVLFSPSGSSFDQYPNFAARGRDFTSLIPNLPHLPTTLS